MATKINKKKDWGSIPPKHQEPNGFSDSKDPLETPPLNITPDVPGTDAPEVTPTFNKDPQSPQFKKEPDQE